MQIVHCESKPLHPVHKPDPCSTIHKIILLNDLVLDRSFVQTQSIPENNLSTVAVAVAIVFFRVINFIKFSDLFSLIGSPILKSIFFLAISITNIEQFTLRHSNCFLCFSLI